MKALVLTYDQQVGLGQLVLKTYKKHAPNANLEFLIPINEESTKEHYVSLGFPIVFVNTPSDILSTMKNLLARVDDEEWVYWCIDDRYPLSVMDDVFCSLINDIDAGKFDHLRGIKMLWWREQGINSNFEYKDLKFTFQDVEEEYGFWHHQFIRAKTLKDFFFTYNEEDINHIMHINRHHRFNTRSHFISDTVFANKNIVTFAEPLAKTKLTMNGLAALKSYDCVIPPYEVLDHNMGFVDCEEQLAKFDKPKRIPDEYFE